MEARLKLPPLYAIVDRETLDARGISVRSFADQLRDGGVRLVQYRDKKNGPQEMLRAASEIGEVFASTGAMLVMNDRADLAALLGWGVHVGQGDLPAEAVWRVLGAHNYVDGINERQKRERSGREGSAEDAAVVVGVSTHNVEQVAEADRDTASYVAVGPVFATSSKKNAEPVVGLEGVRRARALTSKALVAIGGITLENARDVMDAGTESVAVISGLFVAGRSVAEVARDFLARLG